MQNVQEFIKEARKFFSLRRTKFRADSRLPHGKNYWGCWSRLGNGAYGEAWEHSEYPALALKISGPAGWGDDRASAIHFLMWDGESEPRPDVWPEFAQHCMEHPHPNLPEIMHIERAGGMVWGVMPKYMPYPDSPYDPIVSRFRKGMKSKAAAEYWMLPLVDIARGNSVAVDLHAGNIMMHPDTYEPVIIDPFSSQGSGHGVYSDECTYGNTDLSTGESSPTSTGDTTC